MKLDSRFISGAILSGTKFVMTPVQTRIGDPVSLAVVKQEFSVANTFSPGLPSHQPTRLMLEAEARWHYSNHYMSESKGEEVIEDLLARANTKRQRSLLGSQLRDEQEHTRLFSAVMEQIGFDERAQRYANAYSQLVKQQTSLVEKVYVFQILTEAASSAYCEWRIEAMAASEHSKVDHLVLADERRHLVMGQSMLSICDRDELITCLDRDRRLQLLRAMNDLCKSTGQVEMIKALYGDEVASIPPAVGSRLDRLVTRSILQEVRRVEQVITQFTEEGVSI